MTSTNGILSVFSCLGIALTLAYVIGFWRRLAWRLKTQTATSDQGEFAEKIQAWTAALESMFQVELPPPALGTTRPVQPNCAETSRKQKTATSAGQHKPLAMISHGTFLFGLLAAIGFHLLVLRGQSAVTPPAGGKPKVVKVTVPPPPPTPLDQPIPENDKPPILVHVRPEPIAPAAQPPVATPPSPTPLPAPPKPVASVQDTVRMDHVAEIRTQASASPAKESSSGKDAADKTGTAANKDADNPDALPPMEICWSGLAELRNVTQNLGMRVMAINETSGNQILGEVNLDCGKPTLQPCKDSLESFSNRVRMLPANYFPELAAANPAASFWVVVPSAVDREFCDTQRLAIRTRGLGISTVRSMTGRFKLGPFGRYVLEIVDINS